MKIRFLFIVITAMVLAACGGNTPETDTKTHEAKKLTLAQKEEQMHQNTNEFSFSMLSLIASDEEKENICFSPLSANMALGILMNGAAGNTLTQMQNTLGFKNATEEEINDYYHKLIETLPYLDETTIISLANAIWLKENFPILNTYKEISKQVFDATIDNVPTFTDQTVIDMINTWAADNTNQLIKKVLYRDNVDEHTIMIFANALYFKGQWEQKFEKRNTTKKDFTTTAGQKVKADMMHNQDNYRYTETDLGQIIELDYKDKAYCMNILLPKEGLDAKQVAAELTMDTWQNITKRMYSQEVILEVPKFKFKYDRQLKDDLMRAGITDAFQVADFSRLTNEDVALSFVNQYCYINVDEEGTEAAAVTIGGVYTNSVEPMQPREMIIDRPFIFLIREKQYDTILFTGIVGNPTMEE